MTQPEIELEIIQPTEPTEASSSPTRPRQPGCGAGIVAVGVVFGLGMATGVIMANPGQRPTLQEGPIEPTECPAPVQEPLEPITGKHESDREKTAKLNFVVSKEQNDVLVARLNDARSSDEVGQVLNDILGAYNIRVHADALPESQSVYKKSGIDLDALKRQAKRSLAVFSRVPTSLAGVIKQVGGFDLYFASGLHYVKGDVDQPYPAFDGATQEGQRYIAIGLDTSDADFDHILTRELSRQIIYGTCGYEGAHHDSLLQYLNGPSTRYYDDATDSERQELAKRSSYREPTVTIANNSADDATNILTTLLEGKMYDSYTIDSSAGRKSDIVIGRLVHVEPSIRTYFNQLRSDAGMPFPGDLAKLGDSDTDIETACLGFQAPTYEVVALTGIMDYVTMQHRQIELKPVRTATENRYGNKKTTWQYRTTFQGVEDSEVNSRLSYAYQQELQKKFDDSVTAQDITRQLGGDPRSTTHCLDILVTSSS